MAGRAWPRKSSDSSTNQSLPRSDGSNRFSAKPGCAVCAEPVRAKRNTESTEASRAHPNRAPITGEEAKPRIVFSFASFVKQRQEHDPLGKPTHLAVACGLWPDAAPTSNP